MSSFQDLLVSPQQPLLSSNSISAKSTSQRDNMFLAESYEDLLATAIINKVNIEVLLIARELLNIFLDAQVRLLIKENVCKNILLNLLQKFSANYYQRKKVCFKMKIGHRRSIIKIDLKLNQLFVQIESGKAERIMLIS